MRGVSIAAVAVLLAAVMPAKADILVAIDKGQQRMTVSIDGAPAYHWTVSTGKPGYDTPGGSYRAIRLERVYYSKKFDDAPMPNSVFFYGGYAIHGTYEEARLGRPVSHGCVRLARANAETLFALVRARGMSNTRVVVNDGGGFSRGAPMASLRERGYAPITRSIEREYRPAARFERGYDRGFERFGVPPQRGFNAPPRRYMTEAEMREFTRRNGSRW